MQLSAMGIRKFGIVHIAEDSDNYKERSWGAIRKLHRTLR